MDRVRLIMVSVVALVLAVGAAFVARGAASPRPPKVIIAPSPEKATVQVLVARRDLAVGDRIDPGSLGWQPWPADNMNPAYITQGGVSGPAVDPQGKLVKAAGGAVSAATAAVTGPDAKLASYANAVVRQPILRGEPVIDSKLVHAGASGVMAVTLNPGMRAMSLPLSSDSAAGGFILPGDHVDVVQIRRADGAASSSTVMRNVRVLAIDQNTSATKTSSQVGSSATLELSPQQAEDMVLAKAQGELTLVLRSYADAAGDAATGDVHGGSPVVRVFRNGVSTDVKVAR